MDTKAIKLEVTITLASSFHVGGGKGSVASVNYILRDAQNRPYWPGSAAKGKTRQMAMQLYAAKTGIQCGFSHVNTEEGKPCGCLTCDMMGNAGNAKGRLVFSDFSVLEEGGALHEVQIQTRMGNAIDRHRRVAVDDHLFGTEVACATENMVLKGCITGYLQKNKWEDQSELLKASLKHIAFIGGNVSRGIGWVESVEIISIEEKTQHNLNTENSPESQEASGIQECLLNEERNDIKEADVMEQANDTQAYVIQLKLMPKAPLLIGKHSTESNYRDTQYVIPGGVIRACLAKKIVDRTQQNSEGRINYVTEPAKDEMDSPFALLRKEFTNIRIDTMMPQGSKVFPVSARRCKYGDGGCGYDYWDALALIVSETAGESQMCPECKGREERKEGLYIEKDARAVTLKPRTMIVTKSSIDRHRNTSRDEMLYSMRLMTPFAETDIDSNIPLYFSGGLLIDTGKTWENEQLIKELCEILGDEVQVGAYQTSGYGKMKLCGTVEKGMQDTCEDIKRRIMEFNKVVKRTEEIWGKPPQNSDREKERIVIPITLQSDALVTLKYIPEGTEEAMYLGSYLELFQTILKDVKLSRVLAQHGYWRGFDTSKKDDYLKEVRHLIYAGAIFVLEVETLSDDLIKNLLLLQEKGICSEKKPELYAQNGYGKVIIADAFHIDHAKCNKLSLI